MVTQMIGVGEATGAMDSMLQKIADFYEDEVDQATKDMMAMLEPAIIGMLGVCVGGIVISLYYAAVLDDRKIGRIVKKLVWRRGLPRLLHLRFSSDREPLRGT